MAARSDRSVAEGEGKLSVENAVLHDNMRRTLDLRMSQKKASSAESVGELAIRGA